MAKFIEICKEAFTSYLSPKLCIYCNDPITVSSASQYLCSGCYANLCSAAMQNHVIKDTHALFPLNDEVRAMLHGLKYQGMTGIAAEMLQAVPWSDTAFMGWKGKLNLIPVPVNAARRRERGYNQAEYIARAMQQKWGGRLFLGVLKRSRYNISQTALGADERAWNAAGAFVARPPLPPHIVLVDDVYTTGATTEACRYALMRAGAERVEVLTLAYKLSDNGKADWQKDMQLFGQT